MNIKQHIMLVKKEIDNTRSNSGLMDLCSKCKKKQEETRELIIDHFIGLAELGDENAKGKVAMMMSKNGKWRNPEILEPKKDIKRKTCKHCGGTGWIEITKNPGR